MIRKVRQLRFHKPEPEQIRGNVLAGIFKNGDEGCQLSFDDSAGILYVKKATTLRAIHLSRCDWVEFEIEENGQIKKP